MNSFLLLILLCMCSVCGCETVKSSSTMTSERSVVFQAPYGYGNISDWEDFWQDNRLEIFASEARSILLTELAGEDDPELVSQRLRSMGFASKIFYETRRNISYPKLSFGLSLKAPASGFRVRDVRGHFKLKNDNADVRVDLDSLVINDTYSGF